MMQASKLTIDPDKLRFEKMTHAKRSKLRRQNVIDLINSKPYGTPITMREFVDVTQTTSVQGLLKTMIKKGVITKQPITHRKIAYSVNGAPKTIKPPVELVVATPPPAEHQGTTNRLGRGTVYQSVQDYAKDFYWETSSTDLREFIKWMDHKELELRREIA